MTLRTCIEALRENQKSVDNGNKLQIVPYRESRLTYLFKRHFEGEGKVCKILLILCLWENLTTAGNYDNNILVTVKNVI